VSIIPPNNRKLLKIPCIDSGFTLLEVLVSLSILAVGLLGITALQTESLKFNHAALMESQAQFLINDIVERIRANPNTNIYAMTFEEQPSVSPVNCSINPCSSMELALWDLADWRRTVTSSEYLPGGESQILFDNFTRQYTISIRFDWSRLEDPAIDKRTITITTRI
jgi:type IV pilus assembly protein PilV